MIENMTEGLEVDRALTTTRVMAWGLMKLGTHGQQKIFEANRKKAEKETGEAKENCRISNCQIYTK